MDETNNFLASEIPLLMHQALEWMSVRMEKKQKDRIWIENFVNVGKDLNVFDEYEKVAMQLEHNCFEFKFDLSEEELKKAIDAIEELKDKYEPE